MLVVVIPDADAILAQQEREQALYFSAAAEGVLRREGLISVSTLDLSEISSAPANPSYLYTRGVSPHRTVLDLAKQRPLAFEGPLSASVLDWLGLRASVRQVERLTLRLPDKSESWTIARPTVEIGVPARGLKLPRAWTSKAIAIQKLDGIVAESVALEVLLPDGTAAPAVFRHKGVWISALPLFDLIGEHFAFPPLTDRYNTRKRSNRMNELAAMLLKDIANFLEKSADAYTVTCERWPSGFKSAFTIRHDYDRDISPTEHASLMQLYQRLNLKCSMGYLGYLLPEDQIQDLVRQGHEVQLHAYESTSEELARDVQQLGKIADCPVRGVTIHGGTTSIGFRGDMHFAWLERAGVSYVESFSIDAYPSPIYRPDPLGIIRRSSLVASPMHFSMDVSTEVGAHRLDFMLEKVNFNLENGMAAIAMNHPDLNRKELTQLLETLPREFLWCTTLGEICHWERASKYDPTVAAQNGNLLIRFKEPLPQTAVFHVKWGRAADQPLTIPAGSQSAYLRQSGELRVSADAPVQHVAVPRISSRLRPPRGKLKSGLRRARRVVGRVKRLALEAIARTQPRPSATLISRISNRIGIDALAAAVRPEARIVLQRANLQEGEIDFLDLISNPSRWPRLQAVIGLSVANDLHPIMVEAMASIVEAQTPSHARPLDGRNAARAPLPTGNPRARRLAKWIVDRAGKAREGDTNFPREELAYYLASNALRARGVANIIDALGPATVRVLVDHGSGIGLMPWLLAGGTKRIEHAILVEPVARYAPPLQELWQEADSDGFTRWERVETVSENFEYAGPADVILFCQALVRVAPERRGTVLNQAWNALRPGGLLLINEVLTDGETQSGSAQALVNRAELVDIMSWRGAPDLFRMEGDWRIPEDPLLWTVKEIGSTGIIVAKKGELEIATVSAGDQVEEKAENDTPQLPLLATANVGEVGGPVP